VRNNTRFILVLNGLRYPQYNNDYFPNIKRAEEAGRVMDMAFREFRRYPVTAANQVLGQAPVNEGTQPSVPVTPIAAVAATMQVDSHAGLKTVIKTDPGLTAPVAQGQRVGTMTVTAPDFPAMTVPVYAAQPVPRANIFARTWNRYFGKH
jgi:D-alanyl-D-alanine carboxypeptidase (penicillin-binding protein 5/6)